jgi:taurine dioxygenase
METTMSRVQVIGSGGPAGAEIHGVDLAHPLDDATFAAIEDAFHRHMVIYFRNQRLTPNQHIAYSRRFGPLEIHVLKQYLLPDHPEVLRLSNVKNERGEFIGLPDGGQTWHTDTSYRAKPSRASILYSLEIPHDDAGRPLGDTLWSNTAAAYDALPESMKRRLDGLKAIHHYGKRARVANSPRAKLTSEQRAATPEVHHPVVRTHPYTGRKALYVFEGECVGIAGMPEAEALALIKELHEHCLQPQFIYRHRWAVGDVVMWDNCQSLHFAVADYALPQRRLLHRTTIEGGIPF